MSMCEIYIFILTPTLLVTFVNVYQRPPETSVKICFLSVYSISVDIYTWIYVYIPSIPTLLVTFVIVH